MLEIVITEEQRNLMAKGLAYYFVSCSKHEQEMILDLEERLMSAEEGKINDFNPL